MSEQVQRVMDTVRDKPTDLEKHIFLIGLQERNRTLFYRILIDHLEELMPLVYTPTVGRACEEYGHIFRDDIQGTAAVTLAGIFSGLRVTQQPLNEQTILFLGAGEAGIGVGELIVSAMVDDGTPEAEARQKLWFMDSTGLVVASRENLTAHKLAFAHDAEFVPDLLSAVRTLKPTILISASGVRQTFTQDVIEAMADYNERPLIFVLSNPAE